MREKLKKARLEKGMTLDELAKGAGTTFQQINKLEKGERKLSLEWIERIAPALGISPAALLPDDWDIGASEPEPLDIPTLSTILEYVLAHPLTKKMGHKWVAAQVMIWYETARKEPETWKDKLKDMLDIRLKEEELNKP